MIDGGNFLICTEEDEIYGAVVPAPKTIFRMAERCQPGWSIVAGIWPIVDSKNTPDIILIQIEPECQIDLLSNSRATISRVPLLHLDDGFDDFLGGTFWSGLPAAAR